MQMVKIFLFVMLFIATSIANTLSPTLSVEVAGGVTDMEMDKKNIYVATTGGAVDIIDIKTKKIIKTIKLKKIKDFMGDDIDPKVYSVDIYNDAVLLAVQGIKGYSEVYEFKDEKLRRIINIEDKKFVLRAKYINSEKIIFALLSNQFYLYDIKNKNYLWEKHISFSKFSNFVLNEKKDQFLVSDESGDLKLHKVSDGSFMKSYQGKNLDNVFQVDMKKNKIITAGQDMKSVVYNKDSGKAYIKKGRFLVYSAALSPSSKLAAYSKYENNDVQVFHAEYKSDKYKLTGNKMNISKILFLNENELFVGSDSKQLNYFKLN